MKSNQSSKNFKSATRILTIVICIGLAFSLIAVEQSEAILGIALVVVGAFIAGVVIGWLATEGHDSSSPDALVTSEENYVTVWNDFVEDWNNDYIDENVDLANYMMMYNLTYLDSVRRAEHDVASYVHLLNWTDVENNMLSLIAYKENVTKFIISTLHGYNRVDVSILQHAYDTDVWSYTTPMKYGIHSNPSPPTYTYDWKELTFYGNDSGNNYQYKACFGTYPTGYNGKYSINDKFYVTYIYVPNGENIVLKNLDSNIETTYYSGVYDLQGERNEVINVSIRDSGDTGLDNTGVYLFGVPTDFDILQDTFITFQTGFSQVCCGQTQTIEFEKSKFIKSITYFHGDWVSDWVRIVIDGIIRDSEQSYGTETFTYNNYAKNITLTTTSEAKGNMLSITTEGYVYPDMMGGLKVVTEHAGTAHITDNLPAREQIGLAWMVDSYKTIYEGMVANAKILWNLYHGNGWYTTDDIPSEFLVVPPDIIFDNMDALKNLPLDKAQAIYYAWMKQLIDFYDENPDYKGTYDDTNQTVFDDGIIFNATLIHGGNTVFDNHQIYISPLLGNLYLCKDNSYNLTQKIFIYDITDTYVYYGYVGDNLTILNISIDGVETNCTTLGRQTMHDFLLGKYGFSISFTGEWVFPEIENVEIYIGLAVACIGIGIPIAIFGKKYKPIGYILIIIGAGIIIFTIVIPAIQSFLESLVFWD